MFQKIKMFFRRWKQQRIIKKEFAQFELPQTELSLGEQFAYSSFNVVKLAWNGKMLKFVIGNINAIDLIFCGRFPNLHANFINELLRAKGDFSKETEQEVDIVKLQKEEADFDEELCKKTLIKPTYEELYNSMVKVRKSLSNEYEPTNIKEVLPNDFLQSLQTYHFNRLLEIVKKNLIGSILIE